VDTTERQISNKMLFPSNTPEKGKVRRSSGCFRKSATTPDTHSRQETTKKKNTTHNGMRSYGRREDLEANGGASIKPEGGTNAYFQG